MKTHCPNTLLLVARDRLLRADLRAGRTIGVSDIHEEHRHVADDLPSQVEAALHLSKRRAGRVWILAGDIWTQTLSLPPEALSGLSPDEITRALGFEAEPFSGLGAAEAAMAAVPLPGDGRQKQFWFTELPAAHLEQIDYLVRQAGGRLMGISHAGGLMAPLDENAETPWRRVELWPGAIIAVGHSSSKAANVAIINTEPRPGRWLNDAAELEANGAADAAAHWLHASRSLAVDELPREARLSLEDGATQRLFFSAWARQLASGKAAVPRIVSPKRPMSGGVLKAIAAAIGCLTLAACIVVQTFVNIRNDRLAAETQTLKASADRLAALKGDDDKLQKTRDELKESCDKLKEDLENYRRVMQAQRQRLVTVLAVLTQRGGDDLLIRKIDGAENHIVLHGLCLETQFADNLASALADTLGPEGWQVQPPTRQAKDMLVGGGPWEFELRIQEPEIKTALPAKGAFGPVKGGRRPARGAAEPVKIAGAN